jgi:DNA-3-methyladenine glycosylase
MSEFQPKSLKPLPRSFYAPAASVVAPRLLGHWLIRQTLHGPIGGPIVETEAYLKDDPACHGFVGERPRNRAMYGPPGYSYVYLIYGYHFCFNAVCQPPGIAEAVLVRAIEVHFGESILRSHRRVKRVEDLTNGPAKLCAAMHIDRALDAFDLCEADSPLIIAENPDLKAFQRDRGPVVTTPRIGISQAAEWPLRFYLGRSPFVSRKRQAARPLRVRNRSRAKSVRMSAEDGTLNPRQSA